MYVFVLSRYRCHVPFTPRGLFLRCWACVHSAVPAVIAHPRHVHVVDDRGVVDVVNLRHIDIVYGPVVVKPITFPAPAFVTAARVSVAVVNPAIESDPRPPITFVKYKRTAAPAPICWSPQETRLRRQHPGSRHPVVIFVIGIPSPIARRPNVSLPRTDGLRVRRLQRTGKSHPNSNAALRRRGVRERKSRHDRQRDHQRTTCFREIHCPSFCPSILVP